MCGWSSVVVLMPYACVFLLCAPGLVLAYCLIVSCACVCLRLCLLVSFLAVWSGCSLSPLVSCSFATVFSCYLLFPCGYSLALSFAAAFSLTCLLFWLLVLCTASRVCSCYWCVVTDSSTCLCCLLRVPLLCSFPVNFWFTGLWFFLPLLYGSFSSSFFLCVSFYWCGVLVLFGRFFCAKLDFVRFFTQFTQKFWYLAFSVRSFKQI